MRTDNHQIMTPPLRAVREAQGMSLEDCAQRAGIDLGRLSRIERGLSKPTVANLLALARVLGLSDLERHLRLYAGERKG